MTVTATKIARRVITQVAYDQDDIETNRSVNIIVTYRLDDAIPLLRRHTTSQKMMPDRLTATYEDGALYLVDISGPRLLVKGPSPTERLRERYYSHHELSTWVAWAAELIPLHYEETQ